MPQLTQQKKVRGKSRLPRNLSFIGSGPDLSGVSVGDRLVGWYFLLLIPLPGKLGT
jgi:hypothetical protein